MDYTEPPRKARLVKLVRISQLIDKYDDRASQEKNFIGLFGWVENTYMNYSTGPNQVSVHGFAPNDSEARIWSCWLDELETITQDEYEFLFCLRTVTS